MGDIFGSLCMGYSHSNFFYCSITYQVTAQQAEITYQVTAQQAEITYQVTGRTVFRHKKKKRFLTNYSNFTLKEAYFATSKANRRRVRF